MKWQRDEETQSSWSRRLDGMTLAGVWREMPTEGDGSVFDAQRKFQSPLWWRISLFSGHLLFLLSAFVVEEENLFVVFITNCGSLGVGLDWRGVTWNAQFVWWRESDHEKGKPKRTLLGKKGRWCGGKFSRGQSCHWQTQKLMINEYLFGFFAGRICVLSNV